MSLKPQLIVVMGVSGCGKSTIASAIAEHFRYTFIEADDFHSLDNRTHMANGKPLTDEMRAPWIESIRNHLVSLSAVGQSCVLSFSGLKATHRHRIRSTPMITTTLHLEGQRHVIESRMNQRTNHFMPSSLLESQYQALEDPNLEPNTFSVDVDCSIQELIARSLLILKP